MIKGAVFTLGILTTLGGFGFGAIAFLGAAISDSPSASDDAVTSIVIPCAVAGGIGVAMIVGAFFIP